MRKEKIIDQEQRIKNQNGCELLKAALKAWKMIFYLELHSAKVSSQAEDRRITDKHAYPKEEVPPVLQFFKSYQRMSAIKNEKIN